MKTENIFSIKYALFALFMLFSATVMGQVQVTGTVSDELGPVLGATVREKGTQNGTTTDMNGKFQLKVKNVNATLSISFVGYKSQNVNLAGRTSVNVTLKADAQKLRLERFRFLPVRNPARPKTCGLGSALFARRYSGYLG